MNFTFFHVGESKIHAGLLGFGEDRDLKILSGVSVIPDAAREEQLTRVIK